MEQPMPYNPTVSVVIPTYNPDGVLARLIEQLKRQTYRVDLMEVIIVDDCSSTPVYESISPDEFLNVKIIRHETNRGRAAARNTGIENAKNELLIFLDSDVIADENLVLTHATQFDPFKKILYFGTFRWHSEVRNNHFTRFGRWFEYDCVLDKPDLDFIDFHGANFSVASSVLKESGVVFEEQFTRYGMEDLEFGLLLKNQGFVFAFLPDAVVWHHRIATLEEQIRRARSSAYSILYFMEKHPKEKVFRSLHYLSGDIFEKYSPVLRSAQDCAQRLLQDIEKIDQPTLFEQEIVAACGIFLIEYAPWEELYVTKSEPLSVDFEKFSFAPELKNTAVEWAFRVHFLDRIRRGEDSAKKIYNAFIEPLPDIYLRQSLCHEAGRYFILIGREIEAIRILTIGSRHVTEPTKELYLINYLLGSTLKKRGEAQEAQQFFKYVIDNGKKYIHASQYASALYHMGDLYANYIHESKQAQIYFERALSINPNHKAAQLALLN
ncbi:MAG: glycosyltransferase [Candidatus Auribacterota bacterium]|nr:glycosyltransferase [Candidatus Auribacterota bacterium]